MAISAKEKSSRKYNTKTSWCFGASSFMASWMAAASSSAKARSADSWNPIAWASSALSLEMCFRMRSTAIPCVMPRAQGAGILEPSNFAKCFHPHVLEDVERRLRVAGQFGCVIKKRPLHQRDKIFEGVLFTSLAAECDPFVLCSTRSVHGVHFVSNVEGETSKV